MLPNHAGQASQDFVFNNASTFAAGPEDFLKVIGLRAKHVDDSDALKQVVSSAAQTAEETLELVGQAIRLPQGLWPPSYRSTRGDLLHGGAAPIRRLLWQDAISSCIRKSHYAASETRGSSAHMEQREGQHSGVLSKGNGSLGATVSALHRSHEDACRRCVRRMGRAT